jgi:hypothetical protein
MLEAPGNACHHCVYCVNVLLLTFGNNNSNENHKISNHFSETYIGHRSYVSDLLLSGKPE